MCAQTDGVSTLIHVVVGERLRESFFFRRGNEFEFNFPTGGEVSRKQMSARFRRVRQSGELHVVPTTLLFQLILERGILSVPQKREEESRE